jgi:hypothetical protein
MKNKLQFWCFCFLVIVCGCMKAGNTSMTPPSSGIFNCYFIQLTKNINIGFETANISVCVSNGSYSILAQQQFSPYLTLSLAFTLPTANSDTSFYITSNEQSISDMTAVPGAISLVEGMANAESDTLFTLGPSDSLAVTISSGGGYLTGYIGGYLFCTEAKTDGNCGGMWSAPL